MSETPAQSIFELTKVQSHIQEPKTSCRWKTTSLELFYSTVCSLEGFPDGTSGKEPACRCRRDKRRGFDPWVGKMPWRWAWQLTPIFFPGESHGQRSLVGYIVQEITKSQTWLSDWYTHNYVFIHLFFLNYIFISVMLIWELSTYQVHTNDFMQLN